MGALFDLAATGTGARSLSRARGRDEIVVGAGGRVEVVLAGGGRVGGTGEGAFVIFRVEGDRSVVGFLGKDKSLIRGSFEVEALITGRAPSSTLRFFCKLVFLASSSSCSSSSRIGFFRFTPPVDGSLSPALSLSPSIAAFFDMRILVVVTGLFSWPWVEATADGLWGTDEGADALGAGRPPSGVAAVFLSGVSAELPDPESEVF